VPVSRPHEPDDRADERALLDARLRPGAAQRRGEARDLDRAYAAHGHKPGIANYVQDVYARKFAADFSAEMNRSVKWWMDRWTGGVESRRRQRGQWPRRCA